MDCCCHPLEELEHIPPQQPMVVLVAASTSLCGVTVLVVAAKA